MYRAKSIAGVALVFLLIGISRLQWFPISFGIGGLVFALYIALAVERTTISAPSILSQIALLLIGLSVLFSSYLGFQSIFSEIAGRDPNLVIVIGGFMLVPMIALMGFAMTCCAIFSKNASHQWLMYLVKEPERWKEPMF